MPAGTVTKPRPENFPPTHTETLDALLAKPMAEISVKDFYTVVKIARVLLREKRDARLSERFADQVVISDACGNEFKFPLSRIGWQVGDELPRRFSLPITAREPTLPGLPAPAGPTTREYRLVKKDAWSERLTYEEVVK